MINGDYPNEAGGLEYFVSSEFTNFNLHKVPGENTPPPIGGRAHLQPGIAYSIVRPYFYFNPRIQFAMTQYQLSQVASSYYKRPSRTLPIIDLHSGLFFDRDVTLFHTAYRQTLEPQLYYTYVPYRNQDNIPIFDTVTNTLTYDQLFTYNRFSGLDRIADANQVSLGVTTRFIDQQSGLEKARAGIGQIYYFKNRQVTLCYNGNAAENIVDPNCTPDPANYRNKSPLSGVFLYNLNANWSLKGNAIWNPFTNQFDNQTVSLHYQPDSKRIINLDYSYVRGGDILPGESVTDPAGNLSQTDVSVAWPISRDWSAVGRWRQNWNHHHFQDLLYGVQYDSCCWAIRFVAGRNFDGLTPNNTLKYNTQFFLQIALKGLGDIGNNDPSHLLSTSVAGYQSDFGQDF